MAATVYDQTKELNLHELHYLATHPHHVLAIKESFTKAVAETDRHFAINGLDDESDAFRHCYWSALLARDIGYFSALLFTMAHELAPDNSTEQREMDLFNNSVGLLIGKAGGSDQKLARSCMAALLDGRLKVLVPGVVR